MAVCGPLHPCDDLFDLGPSQAETYLGWTPKKNKISHLVELSAQAFNI
jgi:hypothetical protein